MTTAFWSAIAEVLGIASSIFLLMPAIDLNRHLRDVHRSQKVLEQNATDLFKGIGQAGQATLKDAKVPEWSARDQKLLVAGIVTFGVSSAIKLVLVLSQASAPPPSSAGAPGATPTALSGSR